MTTVTRSGINPTPPSFARSAKDLVMTDLRTGPAVLLLHGGGGSRTVAGLAQELSGTARVLAPTHPGFDGTERPADLRSVADLAALYGSLLGDLGLEEVVLVGSSIGGWIACELALRSNGRIGGVVLVDAVGIAVPGETVANPFSLSPVELIRLAAHDPDKMLAAAPLPTPEMRAAQARNLEALRVYDGGMMMQDPGLRARLAGISAPSLVLWGESDGVASPAYGRVYASAMGATFRSIPKAGHLPQIEQPERVTAAIRNFLAEVWG